MPHTEPILYPLPPRPLLHSNVRGSDDLEDELAALRPHAATVSGVAVSARRLDGSQGTDHASDACLECDRWMRQTCYNPLRHNAKITVRAITDQMRTQLLSVTEFLDGLVTYVLSREWHDLFSIYIFRVQPVPHCSQQLGVRFGFFGMIGLQQLPEHIDESPSCSAEADFERQFSCVLILLVVAAAVHGLAQRLLPARIASSVSSIAGTTVGWAAGDAAIRLMIEQSVSAHDAAEAAGTVEVDAATLASSDGYGYGFGATALSVALILLLEPFTIHAIFALLNRPLQACMAMCLRGACDAGTVSGSWLLAAFRGLEALLGWAEEAALAGAFLASKALTMVVLMIWTYVSQLYLITGLTEEQRNSPVHSRLKVLWATTLTLAGALFTEQLVRWREHLEAVSAQEEREQQEAHERQLAQELEEEERKEALGTGQPRESSEAVPTTEARLEPRAGRQLPGGQVPGGRAPPAAADPLACSAAWPSPAATALATGGATLQSSPTARPTTRVSVFLAWVQSMWHLMRESLRRVLSLTEQLFFFATGWAWTYVAFDTAGRASVWLAFEDFLAALGLTLLAVTLILLMPGNKLNQNTSGRLAFGNANLDSTRMAIAKHYLSTSSTFFVGWAWVVFLRDLAAVSGQSVMHVFSPPTVAPIKSTLGLIATDEVHDAPTQSRPPRAAS